MRFACVAVVVSAMACGRSAGGVASSRQELAKEAGAAECRELGPAETASASPIPSDTPVHLAISLALTHPGELEALKKAQQDPRSPDFRRWLTPASFAARFGQSPESYAQVGQWLARAGLRVKEAPSRAFIEGTGTAAQVERLLDVSLVGVAGQPASVHRLAAPVVLPDALRPRIVNIGGLDTRIRYHHRMRMTSGPPGLGPQDTRRFYGLSALMDRGFVGQGQKLVVLASAWSPGNGPSTADILYFLRNVSDARAQYIERKLPNPQNDVDSQAGLGLEFDLDVQAQSIGAPGADSITLVAAPASEVFVTGPNDIVNTEADATAVSISLGICEPGELQNAQLTGFDEAAALRNAVTQGVMEGQTWSAATGDNGIDACTNGSAVAADFPSTIPEMVGAGGSMLPNPPWDGNMALMSYSQEATWNEGQFGGAAGGGVSIIYAPPAYQAGLPTASGRTVPDLALMSGSPGVGIDDLLPGQTEAAFGTSVASPLSAGFFALMASRLGCRLGDIHPTLYALGAAQADGGAAVFHDITTGDISFNGLTGPAAGPGYDQATGWGSLDVTALAEAWPPCPALPDGGTVDAGVAEAPYEACTFMGCDAGCTSLAAGPSTCSPNCDPADAGACSAGTICSAQTIYPVGGTCIPGCHTDADCASTPGTICAPCAQVCVPSGSASGQLGTACTSDATCPDRASCSAARNLPGGYCTQDCTLGSAVGDACGCPVGSVCGTIGRFAPVQMCLLACTTLGQNCGRTGYLCQRQGASTPACLPKCTIVTRNGQTFDTCSAIGGGATCEVDSGVCGGLDPPDAGVPDAGAEVHIAATGDVLGPVSKPCGCGATGVAPTAGALLALALARARRRRS
jgi:hypothetical protein